ncbi:MAG: type III-A CRISPR-associated protein Cas10/Csm1 [Aggregatilineales bacterium]
MEQAVWKAALAGLAHGLRAAKFWPDDVEAFTSAFEPALLDRAVWCARGGPSANEHATALLSPFCQLTLSGKPSFAYDRADSFRFAPLQPLQIASSILFPTPQPAPQPEGDLAKLRAGFQAAVRAGTLLTLSGQLEQTLDAAMRFAWCVPAPGYGNPCDVSLYNHARSVSAVAACLAGSTDGRLALIGGDLSGIQSFIYTLASDGAAKSLRARSFYVQLLTEAVARYVLRQLDLPIVNALYVGGGGFQILAPASAQEIVPAIQEEIQHRLLIAHRAALGVTIHGHVFDADQFERFGAVRDAMSAALNRAKRRPFAAVDAELLAREIGAPIDTGGETAFCRVTGEELMPGYRADDDETPKSAFVKSLEDLGRQLRQATHIVMLDISPQETERVRNWRAALRMFGLAVEVIQAGQPIPTLRDTGSARLARLSPDPAEQDARLQAAFQGREVVSFYYPFARLVPWDDEKDQPKLFDQLADESRGLKRWAVLRMDVDNLGRLFREGYGNRASLARVAGLSFALRLFFEGWLPALAAEPTDETGRLYIQYAGGDDVFVVGAWDAIAEYALRIRESFRAYTAGNPALTLSGGIALVEANFPLYQAARMAGDAEDEAKRYERNGVAKDAIAFLGEVLDWSAYGQAYRRANDLARWCGPGGIVSRALLQNMQQLHLERMRAGERLAGRRGTRPGAAASQRKTRYTRATWLAAYQLTRVIESLRPRSDRAELEPSERDTIIAAAQSIQSEFMQPDARTNVLALSARWAQFLIRERDRKKQD